MRELDNVAASFLCDLAQRANERGWKLVDLLRVARARYGLETEDRGKQFDGFEELVPAQALSSREAPGFGETTQIPNLVNPREWERAWK